MTRATENLPPEGESAGSGAPSGTCSGGGVGMPPPETLSFGFVDVGGARPSSKKDAE